MTKDNEQHLEAIQDIRNMMKKSTRFLSLSGLSGVFAGIYALIGAYVAHLFLVRNIGDYMISRLEGRTEAFEKNQLDFYTVMFGIAFAVLFMSIISAYYFSNRRAKKMGQKLFDHTAWRVLINLSIPLIAGGIFCLALLYHGTICYISSCMLLFYGMALLNASKYTYDDIRYFGFCQILLGLINVFDLGNGLVYWSLGFGVLHIVYGLVMWVKYEKK